ncbi:YjdF family protein [Priestia koreensis]|uniref:DUF2992 domain-containing protein n=1 Tax=Priestia koreensis TaxID=284581 RepID=A0A0M0KZG2_9BACI|nr:YjdF family protein [Priestia koreensis]KOO44211.1 hypothetical protein AMD01_13030 [Priestia koreensis]
MMLTIYFEKTFWVGVVEFEESDCLKAVRYVFGSEPKDEEILTFIHTKLPTLIQTVHSSVSPFAKAKKCVNPKRLARQAANATKQTGISTKAQAALKEDLECRKILRKKVSRKQREEETARKRSLKVVKRKKKHRGK